MFIPGIALLCWNGAIRKSAAEGVWHFCIRPRQISGPAGQRKKF